jgi:hypothetical protein
MKASNKFLSISAAARVLCVSRDTLYRWLDRGCPHHNGKLDPVEVSNWRIGSYKDPLPRTGAPTAPGSGGESIEAIQADLRRELAIMYEREEQEQQSGKRE